ncbi:NADH-quinone oxidoreductase subunit N [Peribacillus deserti]|uniref:NADH-quinone oxidoreductase subunit N n=1 Tax=Peribacillus deserti TaxID=673318 RepID=A0ABS2QCI7_9BACI|nr:NADH-quinone oxidoreductase subunit NuoN [Peribacillus deserti]MBM7690700.1 NADH-quinone oxidoreductase subunit N [Peribacillus deserti]
MNLDTLLSYEWGHMAPEFIILAVAALLSLLDLFLPKSYNRRSLAWIALVGILVAVVSLIGLLDSKSVSILHDTFRLDSFGKAFKLILLIGAACVILLAESYEPKEGLKEYRGEFYYLFLTGLLGAMVMTSSGDLITLFVGLELLSISSYILAGMRKKNPGSNEAAMKYVINGGISTAITLFGMSYLYGLSGTTNLKEMSGAMSAQAANGQFLYLYGLAFFMVLIGLSFKLASAPFHMWAPDVYQGSPTPVTAFLSVVSKTAGFVILLRIILTLFLTMPGDDTQKLSFLETHSIYISCLAGISIIAGNVIALRQRNIKRMFAYSSIAHAGYILVAISALGYFTFDAVWFYLLAYLLMNLGAFAVIQLITDSSHSEDIADFAGLYRRSPLLAAGFAVFILSLAGIPGTAGFIGKLNIFMNALMTDPGHFVLASIMIAGTVISYFYYFGIMTQMFFRPAASTEKIKVPAGIGAVVVLALAGTILFGVAPNTALDFLHNNFGSFNDFLK